MRPLLSICIPTFSRADMVYNTVLNHLEFNSNLIEVVVCDNCSEDNTMVLLSSIEDSRLRIYQNDTNRGFHYNLVQSIKKAQGHYICTMSDEDVLNHNELSKVIEWLQSFVEDNYEIGAIIPGNSANIITKKDELVNALYGRTSYMSGIIINKDMLRDEDLELKYENYYPHVQLVLTCGAKARIVFSPYNLCMQKFNDEKEGMNRIKLQSKAKTTCKASPYTPESRYEQLKVEKSMILNLNISDRTKFHLLKRQYMVKTNQATITYELVARSKSKLNSLGINEEHNSIGLEYDMGNTFVEIVQDNLTEEYKNLAYEVTHQYEQHIKNIRRNRYEFDVLTKKEGYTSVIAGTDSFISNYIDYLVKYNFTVNNVSISNVEMNSHINIPTEKLVEYEKVVIIVDQNDTQYVNKLLAMDFKDAHMFYIQDLDVLN